MLRDVIRAGGAWWTSPGFPARTERLERVGVLGRLVAEGREAAAGVRGPRVANGEAPSQVGRSAVNYGSVRRDIADRPCPAGVVEEKYERASGMPPFGTRTTPELRRKLNALQGGWQNLVRQDGTGFKNQGDCVSYAAQGGTPNQKPAAGPIKVTEPMFNYNANTCSVTVPYTPGLDTRLYAVNGYPQDAPITHDVTVTAGLDGAAGTAPQFWIGYAAQPGYVDTNPGAGTWHIDFYNGDPIRDCTA
jgi:hypothetical protein